MDVEPVLDGFPRRFSAYAIVAVVIVVGTVWLGRTVLPPHAATAEMLLEVDPSDSIGPKRSIDSNEPLNTLSGLWRQGVGERAGELLQPFSLEDDIDPAYFQDRLSFRTDSDVFKVEVRLSTDRRDLAREGVRAVVTAYTERSTEFPKQTEAGPIASPPWVVVSSTSPVDRSGLSALVVVLYLLGTGAMVAFVPKDWWSDPTNLTNSAATAWLLLAVGLAGGILFGAADLFGYGYPGIGVVQLLGLAAMSGTALAGASDLVARREISH